MPFWQTLLAAVIAAVLALSGNAIMLFLQGKAKISEERRAFVRQMHDATVDAVADFDLFVRDLRRYVVVGPWDADDQKAVKKIIEEKWEGDLLRRVRRLRFGHPDPDVRNAAEDLEDALWPYTVVAGHRSDDENPSLREMARKHDRGKIQAAVEESMTELRRAVYAAPIRKQPSEIEYSGENRPTYLARAMQRDQEAAEADQRPARP